MKSRIVKVVCTVLTAATLIGSSPCYIYADVLDKSNTELQTPIVNEGKTEINTEGAISENEIPNPEITKEDISENEVPNPEMTEEAISGNEEQNSGITEEAANENEMSDQEIIEDTETVSGDSKEDAAPVQGYEEPLEAVQNTSDTTIHGEWLQVGSRWWFRHDDGTYTKNGWEWIWGNWFYFDAEGWMVTGWVESGGNWYYCREDGKRTTYWNLIDGSWYFFDPTTGVMNIGWLEYGDKWYYCKENGKMTTYWNLIYGSWYFFDPTTGVMNTGWLEYGDKWYYCNPSNGKMTTYWNLIDGKWYFFDATTGVMQTGWFNWQGKRYYLLSNGAMVTGNYRIGDIPYYFDSEGAVDMGITVVNYAKQFIGNPYVWGGESLTNGCDCSGFTMKVFEKFGVTLTHSSEAQRTSGNHPIASLAEARPGDLLCFDGHVGIYMGNGEMVNASNSKPYPEGGIKVSPVAGRTILAIRRLV